MDLLALGAIISTTIVGGPDMTWLKIAGIVVVLIVVVVVVTNFLGTKKAATPPQPAPTLDRVWQQDQQRLNAPIPQPNQPTADAAPQPVFKPLTEEQAARAEQLWQMVVTSRKMGRLPVIPYGQMVQYCRQIINEFPGSEYAYRAKLALADIPDSARRQYNITEQELDVSGFYKRQ